MVRVTISLALVTLLGVAWHASAQTKEAPVKEYISDKGKFKTVLPGKPSLTSKDLSIGRDGVTVPVTTERVETATRAILSVSYADYPESFREVPPKAILDGVRDGLKGSDGKISDETEIRFGPGKHPGRELRIVAGKNVIRVRIVLVGTRLYEVMITGSKDAVSSSSAEAFWNGFEVLR